MVTLLWMTSSDVFASRVKNQWGPSANCWIMSTTFEGTGWYIEKVFDHYKDVPPCGMDHLVWVALFLWIYVSEGSLTFYVLPGCQKLTWHLTYYMFKSTPNLFALHHSTHNKTVATRMFSILVLEVWVVSQCFYLAESLVVALNIQILTLCMQKSMFVPQIVCWKPSPGTWTPWALVWEELLPPSPDLETPRWTRATANMLAAPVMSRRGGGRAPRW